MKYILSISFVLLSLLSFGQKYSYTVKVEGSKDTIAYLASYYGSKLFYNDTAEVKKQGVFVFEGEGVKPGGIYAFVFPNQRYFEFIIAEPKFSLETDTLDFISNMKVKGSEENEVFFEQMQFISIQNDKVQKLIAERDSLKQSGKQKKRLTKVEGEIEAINNAVKASRQKITDEHANLYVSKVFAATQEVEVPEDVLEGLEGDALKEKRFNYYKAHFFDGIDFKDERMMRTPVFQRKIETYLDKLTIQVPDSIIASSIEIIEKAKSNKELFRFLLNYVTSTYEQSKIMGMDAVFVAMVDKYYATGEASWVKADQLEKLTDRASKLKPTLLGKRAPFLNMQDTSGVWKNMYEVEEPITVLFIWDPDCGNCKKAMPKLISFYEEYKSKGVEIYAVSTDFENKKWKKYLKENPGMNWINVSDSPKHPNVFRDVYDVYSTPRLFVLDANKIIKAKRLGVEQLPDFVDYLLKKDK